MHTVAYESILAKLKRGGRERLDGFISSDFSGITANERQELINLFEAENDFSNLALLLPSEKFYEFLRRAIDNLPVETNEYVDALISAHKVGAIKGAVELLIDGLEKFPALPLGMALGYLSTVDIPARLNNNYSQKLLGILGGKDATPAVMLKASNEILRAKGFTPRSVEYMDMSSRLQAKDRRVRSAALSDLAVRK